MNEAVKICEKNKKVLEYKGKPIMLLCATEHYGSVMNGAFDYKAYLEECADKKQNYTRLFLMFRELQTCFDPYSTCKSETPDYISPYTRSGGGKATDGLPLYDLDSWNPEFFDRLHDFLTIAEQKGVIAEVVFFSCGYLQEYYDLQPLGAKNNINGVHDTYFPVAMSMKDEKLFEYQKKYVEKVVREINKYPNFIFEICNEPACVDAGAVSLQEVNDWQNAFVKLIRDIEKDMPLKHLIAAEESWDWPEIDDTRRTMDTEYNFNEMDIDIVNIHPGENILYKGKRYDMNEFMSKQLKLKSVRDFCVDTWGEDKAVNLDEDNAASAFLDEEAWTIQRKRAWTTIMSGAHYDYIDFSITIFTPAGTPRSRACVRTWFKNLQSYVDGMDLINGAPMKDALGGCPDYILPSVYGSKDEYNIYLADCREREEEGCGDAISNLELELPEGEYDACLYSPASGQFSPIVRIKDRIKLPEFTHDIAIKLSR